MSGLTLPGARREQFPELLRNLGYETGAEIGVAAGEHAEFLLKNWPGSLLLVDCWQKQDWAIHCDSEALTTDEGHEQNYQHALDRMRPFGTRAAFVRKFSIAAASSIREGSLDFVYLDANHSYKAVCADLLAWYPRVKSGGLMSGHDFVDSGNPFGVKSAVLEFIADLPVDLYVAPNEDWKTWYWRKP